LIIKKSNCVGTGRKPEFQNLASKMPNWQPVFEQYLFELAVRIGNTTRGRKWNFREQKHPFKYYIPSEKFTCEKF